MANLTQLIAALTVVQRQEGDLEVVIIKQAQFRPAVLVSAFVELLELEEGGQRVVVIKEYT